MLLMLNTTMPQTNMKQHVAPLPVTESEGSDNETSFQAAGHLKIASPRGSKPSTKRRKVEAEDEQDVMQKLVAQTHKRKLEEKEQEIKDLTLKVSKYLSIMEDSGLPPPSPLTSCGVAAKRPNKAAVSGKTHAPGKKNKRRPRTTTVVPGAMFKPPTYATIANHQATPKKRRKPESPMKPLRAMIFIDGTNLYYSLFVGGEDKGTTKPSAVARKFGPNWFQNYFVDWTAFRHIIELRMTEDFGTRDQSVVVSETRVYTSLKKNPYQRSPRVQFFNDMRSHLFNLHLTEWTTEAEKCVDVHLAVQMVEFAATGGSVMASSTSPGNPREGTHAYDIAVLVSGDKDFVPALVTARKYGKHTAIVTTKDGCSRDLQDDIKTLPIVKDYPNLWIDDILNDIIVPRRGKFMVPNSPLVVCNYQLWTSPVAASGGNKHSTFSDWRWERDADANTTWAHKNAGSQILGRCSTKHNGNSLAGANRPLNFASSARQQYPHQKHQYHHQHRQHHHYQQQQQYQHSGKEWRRTVKTTRRNAITSTTKNDKIDSNSNLVAAAPICGEDKTKQASSSSGVQNHVEKTTNWHGRARAEIVAIASSEGANSSPALPDDTSLSWAQANGLLGTKDVEEVQDATVVEASSKAPPFGDATTQESSSVDENTADTSSKLPAVPDTEQKAQMPLNEPVNKIDFDSILSVTELRDVCRKLGLPHAGVKADLVGRIEDHCKDADGRDTLLDGIKKILSSCAVPVLQKRLKKLGLESKGKKQDLITRLLAH
jgi:hypothetical protein